MPKTATAGEPDPNDDVEERVRDQALNALELPGHGYELSTTRIALRDAFDYLRGQGQATAKDFKQEVYPQTKADTYFDTPTAWWRDGCKPYLRQLPGVVPPSGTGNPWRFDGDRVELPDDDPDAPDISPDRKLTEPEVEDVVDDLDLPGRTPIRKAKHCAALRDMVLLLQEHGLATSEELRNLRAMPGVEAPDAAGDCWRFVGVA